MMPERRISKPRVSKTEQATVPDNEVKRELVERLMSPDAPIGETAITSLWPGTLIVPVPSGATYRWDNAGATVVVANQDVEFVMSKNRGGKRACCGSGGGRTYFQIN